jgi:hypothetical protein
VPGYLIVCVLRVYLLRIDRMRSMYSWSTIHFPIASYVSQGCILYLVAAPGPVRARPRKKGTLVET